MNPDDLKKQYQELLLNYPDRCDWPEEYRNYEDAFYDFGWEDDKTVRAWYTYERTEALSEWADYDIARDIVEARPKPILTIFKKGDLVRIPSRRVYDSAEQPVGKLPEIIGLIIEVESKSEAPDQMALIIDSTTNQQRWVLLNDLELAND
ncbi:MAG: hypothetical protein CME70_18840 [Halobacteriovorax sp.]|nr:hypothetical protein [Halobacteriovorax sp.]